MLPQKPEFLQCSVKKQRNQPMCRVGCLAGHKHIIPDRLADNLMRRLPQTIKGCRFRWPFENNAF
jgi:hypothetical protein